MTQRLGVAVVFSVIGLAFAAGGGGCALEPGDDLGESAEALRIDCAYVKCMMPLCTPEQHLVINNGECCPRCVGPQDHANNGNHLDCATVLCAAVECADGEVAVTPNGQCCPRCRPLGSVQVCDFDADCPQLNCFACPCPVSECRGHQCVTWTPDRSTCGGL